MDFISRRAPEQSTSGTPNPTRESTPPPSSPPAGSDRIATELSEDTEFNGTLKFGKTLKIAGKFQGDLKSPGHLIIGRTGQVRAEVEVGSITVEGKLTGNIKAKDLVDLRSNAEVFGDISASKIKIEEGVVLLGKTEIRSNESKSKPLNQEFLAGGPGPSAASGSIPGGAGGPAGGKNDQKNK
jgi:cytoskeletal protein CcmA (bactofilin family)